MYFLEFKADCISKETVTATSKSLEKLTIYAQKLMKTYSDRIDCEGADYHIYDSFEDGEITVIDRDNPYDAYHEEFRDFDDNDDDSETLSFEEDFSAADGLDDDF